VDGRDCKRHAVSARLHLRLHTALIELEPSHEESKRKVPNLNYGLLKLYVNNVMKC